MVKGRARLAMSQGVSVWVLDAPHGFGDAGVHAHHAIQITAALTGTLSLTSSSGTLAGAVLAVAADAPHRFEARGLLAFIFVEPESRPGRALTRELFGSSELVSVDDPVIRDLLSPLRATFDGRLNNDALLCAGRSAVERLTQSIEAPSPDPRVQRVIDFAAAHLEQPLGLALAADHVCLSPSRLRHLFVEQTGLAFKTYLSWLRLVRAVELYSEGESLTSAAHAAGFSDSAHFSRLFRRTFGLPATTLTRL
jgi:AraC family transcriptional regulator